MIASILLLFSVGRLWSTEATAAAAPAPTLSAASSVLYECHSGTFVCGKDADTQRPMASTTKIMTALVAARRANSLDDTVTVPKEAVGVEGSSLYLREGEQLPLRELLYGLLLQSANDAAVAIAVHVSGSLEAFVCEMNETAHELGLSRTHFVNPHGLHDDLHYTTARELALISAAALDDPTVKTIASTVRHTIPATNLSPARTIVNHNKLLRLCDGAIGLKTGFTKASGRCLVGAFERDGLLLVTVTLSAPNDWDDHRKLLDYGLCTLEARTVAEKGALHYEIPIIGAGVSSIRCTNADDVTLILPRDATPPEPRIHLSHFAVAPIREGAVMGRLTYERDGKVLFDTSLVAEETVA
jgi:D-alanyl-D-alanine carboxypeptidase/D-alanyl-D-alanine carboxypeptidase (penicillin-binding protein 5/6)